MTFGCATQSPTQYEHTKLIELDYLLWCFCAILRLHKQIAGTETNTEMHCETVDSWVYIH